MNVADANRQGIERTTYFQIAVERVFGPRQRGLPIRSAPCVFECLVAQSSTHAAGRMKHRESVGLHRWFADPDRVR